MKPIDVGAPELIPQGNLRPGNPGNFAGIMAEFQKRRKQMKYTSISSMNFKTGYGGPNSQAFNGFDTGWT